MRLRNEVQYHIHDKARLERWVPEAESWRDSVVTEVRKLSQVSAIRLRTLNRFRSNQAPVSQSIADLVRGIEHQRWADIQNERLSRLEEFLAGEKSLLDPRQDTRQEADIGRRTRPTAIRLSKGADDALIIDSVFVGDMDGIVNEGASRMRYVRDRHIVPGQLKTPGQRKKRGRPKR